MSYQLIKDKLDRGEFVLLDGGTGTETERQGVSMDAVGWCAVAHVESPQVVQQVHESYIQTGADVIIANTFATAPHVLRRLGLEDQIAEINQSAVALALAARENLGKDVCIAASVSSMPAFDEFSIPKTAQVREGFIRQAQLLAEAGAELLIAEMMRDVDISAMVISAARATGLPVWTGFSASTDATGALINYMSDVRDTVTMPFGQMAREVLTLGCDAAGVMHSNVRDTGPALDELGKLWDGPVFAYAESGYFAPPNWKFEDIISPEAYLDHARQWVSQGVQIVGGCCGIGPEHISVLHENLGKT